MAYLLGELPEEEQIEFEQSFLADEDQFELLRAVEHDLMCDYVRGKLPTERKARFERLFLKIPERREHLHLIKSLVEYLERESQAAQPRKAIDFQPKGTWWDRFVQFFRVNFTPVGLSMAVGALAVVVFGATFWIVWRTMRSSTPGTTDLAQIQELRQNLETERTERRAREQQTQHLQSQLTTEQEQRRKTEQEIETLRKKLETSSSPGPETPTKGAPSITLPTIVGSRGGTDAPPSQTEDRYWNRIRSSSNPEDFSRFLQKYPTGKYGETARRQFEKLKSFELSQGYLQLGLSQYRVGNYREALASFQQAAQLSPKLGEAHFNLGMTYVQLNQREAAQQEHEMLKTLNLSLAEKLLIEIRQESKKTAD